MKTRRKKIEPLLFWLKTTITEGGCILWDGAVGNHGYGVFNWREPGDQGRGRVWTTHRWIWTRINGPIPDGLHVLHSCDVRRCVNPAHLSLGTNQDNINDMMARRRHFKFSYTHCKRGHHLVDGAYYVRKSDGAKICKECQKIRVAKYVASRGGRVRASCRTATP